MKRFFSLTLFCIAWLQFNFAAVGQIYITGGSAGTTLTTSSDLQIATLELGTTSADGAAKLTIKGAGSTTGKAFSILPSNSSTATAYIQDNGLILSKGSTYDISINSNLGAFGYVHVLSTGTAPTTNNYTFAADANELYTKRNVNADTDNTRDLGGSSIGWKQLYLSRTVTAGGTTGAQTIHKNAGRVNFAATDTSLVVTNNRVTTSSVIICTVNTNDSTLKSVSAVPASGSFTIYGNAAATAETAVSFLLLN
jgi:hypothetical protein